MLCSLFHNGYRLVVITNQQGVGMGLVSVEELRRIHEQMRNSIKQRGAVIGGIHYCPHLASDNCSCRKPKPGMILRAIQALPYDVDLNGSWFVGDSPTDVEAGNAAGLRTILVGDRQPLEGRSSPDLSLETIAKVADAIARSGH